MKSIFTLLAGFSLTLSVAQTGSEFYQLHIRRSNNTLLNEGYRHLDLPDKISDPGCTQLKKYVLEKTAFDLSGESEVILHALEWVSTQWKHDGLNQAPDSLSSLQILKNANKGVQYRCVEYGKVLKDVLQSLGYVSRSVGLKQVETAYGGFGMAHVAAEVWSNRLQKWIFIDPQFSVYPQYNGEFISYYELYKLSKDGHFKSVTFTVTGGFLKANPDIDTATYLSNYKNFIRAYIGYMDYSYMRNGQKTNLSLFLDARSPYITFQGFTSEPVIFTKNPDNFYFDLNRTLVVFHPEKPNDYMKTFKEMDIKGPDDFVNKMPLFASDGSYLLRFENNMPWFDHYEIRINGAEWKRVAADGKFPLKIQKGNTTLEVLAVNEAGVKGVATFIEIDFVKGPPPPNKGWAEFKD